jgi:hypothetical protein
MGIGGTLMTKKLIGKNDQGDRFYLTLEIKNNEREATTINHQKVLGYQTLSICGEVVEYRKQNASNFGQIRDRLSEITQPSKGFTLKDIARINEIWEKWHLNDLQSHCSHQDKAIKWDQVNPCPLNGYKAGSAWLLNELPLEIINEMQIFLNETAVI